MRDFLVVAVHETNKIFFVKRSDIDTILIIEFINEVSILDNHHPFGRTNVNHVIRKPLLLMHDIISNICRPYGT